MNAFDVPTGPVQAFRASSVPASSSAGNHPQSETSGSPGPGGRSVGYKNPAHDLLAKYEAEKPKTIHLSSKAVESIDRGLGIHVTASLVFGIALMVQAIGVSSFVAAATLAAVEQAGEQMQSGHGGTTATGPAGREAKQFMAKTIATFLVVSAIAATIGSLLIVLSVIIDIPAFYFCWAFPPDYGSQLFVLFASVLNTIGVLILIGSAVTLNLGLDINAIQSMLIALALATVPIFFSWILLTCGEIGFAKYLGRNEFKEEGATIIILGIVTVSILALVPASVTWIIATGNSVWLIVFAACGYFVFAGLLRGGLFEPLVYGASVLSGYRLAIQQANFIDSLRICTEQARKPITSASK